MQKRILIICPRVPFPLRDGGAMAMYQSIEMYKEMEFEVHLFCLNTKKHWLNDKDKPKLFTQLSSYQSVFVNSDVKIKDAFLNIFTKESYNISRFISKEVSNQLNNLLKENRFDFIQFESIYTAPYLEMVRDLSQAKCILRMHNLEYVIWEDLAKKENNYFKRKYLQILATRLKKYETQQFSLFDFIFCISEKEKNLLEQLEIKAQCYYLPYGIEKNRFRLDSFQPEINSIFHLGSMDWLPNQEGVIWFCEEVWPRLKEEHKNLKFYLAGKNMPKHFEAYKRKGIDVLGEIDDAKTFILEKNIMLIPLFQGGGIRIKILEALIQGKTIVSTSKGVEGLNLENEKHFLLANNAKEFIDKINWCLKNQEASKAIGIQAQEWVTAHFEKRKLMQNLKTFLENLNV